MDITREYMGEIFKAFSFNFSAGLNRGRMIPQLPSGMISYRAKLREISTVVPSNAVVQTHPWLQQLAGFVSWSGKREITLASWESAKVKNDLFTQTVAVPRLDLEAGGAQAYGPMFEALGAEANEDAFWLDLAISAITGVGKWVDGAAFYGTTRKYGANTISNSITAALTPDGLSTLWGTIGSYKGEKGNPVAMPYMLVSSMADFPVLRQICESEYTVQGGVQTPNKARGLFVPRWHEKLQTTGTYYALSTNGGVMGVCTQQFDKGNVLVRKDKETDDNMFDNEEARYGSRAAGAAFPVFPHLVAKVAVA